MLLAALTYLLYNLHTFCSKCKCKRRGCSYFVVYLILQYLSFSFYHLLKECVKVIPHLTGQNYKRDI